MRKRKALRSALAAAGLAFALTALFAGGASAATKVYLTYNGGTVLSPGTPVEAEATSNWSVTTSAGRIYCQRGLAEGYDSLVGVSGVNNAAHDVETMNVRTGGFAGETVCVSSFALGPNAQFFFYETLGKGPLGALTFTKNSANVPVVEFKGAPSTEIQIGFLPIGESIRVCNYGPLKFKGSGSYGSEVAWSWTNQKLKRAAYSNALCPSTATFSISSMTAYAISGGYYHLEGSIK